jgi:hypothetical protein
MRNLISGLVAAVAVIAAAPAMACGYSSCGAPLVYAAPVAVYTSSGCNPCGGVGWGYGGYGYARLADPEQQYYYVNQGPTYSGPGAWAPQPTYAEPSVSGWSSYSRPYDYGYVARPRAWGPRAYGYGAVRPYGAAYRYGYASRRVYAAPYGYGQRAMRRYY